MPAAGLAYPSGANEVSLGQSVRNCKRAVQEVIDTAKQCKQLPEDVKSLTAVIRRLQPLLDDLEDNVVEGSAVSKGVANIQALEQTVHRVGSAIKATISIGPLQLLLQQGSGMAEFVNLSVDLLAALKALDLVELKVDEMQVEATNLLLGQLAKLQANYTPCVEKAKLLFDMRNQAEDIRVRKLQSPTAVKGQSQQVSQQQQQSSVADMVSPLLTGCTVAQLSSDVAYLQEELATSQKAHKHVESFFLTQLLSAVMPFIPSKDSATGKGNTSPQVVVPVKTSTQLTQPTQPASVDPVPMVQELLSVLMTPTLTLEQRAAALRPLVVAAGLVPGDGGQQGCYTDEGTGLHGGAVLFALTDKDCAQKVVALVNEPGTEPLIKGWLLALILSLVHPERGLNPETQQALVASGLPTALCRLVVRTTTPAEQRLQALTMLRVLASDPTTHQPMIEAKVLNSLVQQIAHVRVIKGQLVGSTPSTPPQTSTSAVTKAGTSARQPSPTKTGRAATLTTPSTPPQGPEYDLEQQNIELAIMMIEELAPGPFKADILSAGGVKALVHCICNIGNLERVRASAARALSILLVDGAIAVEAARDDLLVGLVPLMYSKDAAVQKSAATAVQQLLTPTPPTSAQTAAVAAAANSPAVTLPPQGKAAKLANKQPSGANAIPVVAATTTPKFTATSTSKATDSLTKPGGNAALTAQSTASPNAAAELFQSMGKVLSPRSTAALMDLLALDNPVLTPLALTFLPLTATDPACRAAIITAQKGIPVLLREAGKSANQGAISALQRVASDLKLKSQCAFVIAQALASCPDDLEYQANMAGALAAVGDLPVGAEKDKPAVAAATAFAAEVLSAGGIPPLIGLIKSNDFRPKAEGVRALRVMSVYGDDKVKDAIIKADALLHLVEATKIETPLPGGKDPVSRAAAEALAGLGVACAAKSDASRTQVFTALVGYLGTPSLASIACTACLTVANGSADAYTSLHKCGALNPILAMIGRGSPTELTGPCRLLAGIVAASPELADIAVQADACTVLPIALERGDSQARVAAAAATTHLMRRSDKARNQIVDRKGLTLLVEACKACEPTDPYFADVASSLAVLATLHDASRYELSRTVRTVMLRQDQGIAAAAATCSQMAHGAKGREILFSDDLIDALIKLLGNSGSPDAQRLAADALLHAASVSNVTLTPSAGGTGASGNGTATVNPKPLIINKGGIDGLAQMLRSLNEQVVYEASLCLECLCGCEEGVRAAKRARVSELLHEVMQAGKKGEMSDRTAKAAYAAYLKLM